MDVIKEVFDQKGAVLLFAAFVIFFWLETKFELRKRVSDRFKRIVTNAVFGFPAFIMLRLLFIPAMVWLAVENESWQVGINHWIDLPDWAAFVVGFLLLDYLIYIWHWLTHKVPLFWRFHKVHHTDLDLDITTALRFHFGELFLSLFFRGLTVVITGASPLLVIIYEIIFELANNFHHSNWRLNKRAEKILNFFIVTPRMHGIHHSIVKGETDSNYSTIFSWWDRLHQTFNLQRPQKDITIGLPEHQDATELTVWELIRMPFRKNT